MSLIVCTAAKPWDKQRRPDEWVQHFDAREVGEQENGYPGGDIVTYRCPHCGHEWQAELPQ
jgi:hypothetical protein